MLERESVAHKEGSSAEEEKERRGYDWSVIEVKRVFVQIRVPDPMERMEEEWLSEGEEVNIISSNVSVPVDVMERRGDASDTLSATVKDLNATE